MRACLRTLRALQSERHRGSRQRPGPGHLPQHAAAAARSLDEPSREAVEAALHKADGVVSRAAQNLGLSRQALYRRMERYGLAAPV